jgi:hypothetical protein|tara:strand:- start:52 stop:645 length:594 start_codon:yes stop_codon:yes gene_type:complete
MAIVTNDWTARITGSAYTDNTNNKITAPHGKYIIAIQATGNAGSANNALVKVVAHDSSMHWNTEAAAHVGTASDTVDESSGVSNAATFTMDTSYVTKGYAVGYFVDGIGIPYGTKVKAVNVGGDPKEITLDTNVTLSDEQTIYFTDPNDTVHGTGGMNAGTGTNLRVVVGGGYYMGRWLSVQPVTDDGNGVICYFGE